MSKRDQWEDFVTSGRLGSDAVELSEFVPFCEDCYVHCPDWSGDDEMRVQCDSCNSNNEG